MIELAINTDSRNQMVDVTSIVAGKIPSSFSGIVLIYVPHTTAGVTINEGADPDVRRDMISYLQKLVPHSHSYLHSEGNADAHIKSSLVGHSVQLIAQAGRLRLGTWQALYFCEFDGPRTRKIYIEMIKNE